MNFNFTISSDTGSTKPLFQSLEANKIHEVIFDGVDINNIEKKDGTATYKVIKFKFKNEDGTFEHTLFEPTDRDGERPVSQVTSKDGKPLEIVNPSNVESMMLMIKHLIDAVLPDISKKIESGEVKIGGKGGWDGFRKDVKDLLDKAIGQKTKIKLIANKNGYAVFPGYFAALTREDKTPYIRNHFIGKTLAFQSYELNRIKNSQVKPTEMDSMDLDVSSKEVESDLDFDIDSL